MQQTVPLSQTGGSLFLGTLGAFLGALIGAIPWFMVNAFAGIFVGWLGFLIGYCSAWGYRICSGKRSTRYAVAVVFICVALVLIAADFLSNLIMLCADAQWQKTADANDMSVLSLAVESLLLTENLSVVLPNLGIGLLVGMIGALCAKKNILAYTAPAFSSQVEMQQKTQYQSATTQTQIPQSLLVLPHRTGILWESLVAIICLSVIIGCMIYGKHTYGVFIVAAFAATMFCMICRMISVSNRKIEVQGELLCAVNAFGTRMQFTFQHIALVRQKNCIHFILLAADGQKLAHFDRKMRGAEQLLQILCSRGIPFQAT